MAPSRGGAPFLVIRAINRLAVKKDEAPAEPTTKDCPYCATAIPIKATRCTPGSPVGCHSHKGRCLTHDLWEELGNEWAAVYVFECLTCGKVMAVEQSY